AEPEEERLNAWEAQAAEPEEEQLDAWEAQAEASAQDFSDFADQVVFDPEFLKEQELAEVFAQPENVSEPEAVPQAQEAADDAPGQEDDAPEFILPTFRGFFYEEDEKETGVEQSVEPVEESAGEEPAADSEPEVPETAGEVAESDTPVSQAEERRRRLQEKLQEIYRRNQELQKAEAEHPEEWQNF
ncbi:MAG: hypothetical protein Q4C48_12140, partial [Lachnospiraceae bacterium]|nr:hypothetical protein [Lachnospiraceae bacterium]